MCNPMVTNASLLARKFKDRPVEDILNIYVKYPTIVSAHHFFDEVFKISPPGIFRGTGVEVGAGVAVFSAMVCKRHEAVDRIYTVEIVPEVAEFLQPTVIRAIGGEKAEKKINNVIGSFDNLRLEDESIDFCIEIGSLHHSHDMQRTLNEIARVLRPGGWLVVLDRAHNNGLTETQRKFMLDVQYGESWLKANGFSPDPLSRRENGEHEYTLSEWEEAFTQSGFYLHSRFELRPVGWRRFLRSCILEIPFPMRRRLNWLPSRVKEHPGENWWRLQELLGRKQKNPLFRPSINEYSAFINRKQAS